ncbi:transporter substrate-binding domain-containing protein [Klebsiella oxytoca]|uniref:transporter substrate-binding domain-containing protein n=1 Tax=Klebsiella TaxID=570 RepID=UPI000F4E56C3|nr:transporter substrate-binding domain-containing protein [Klebsiella oxytoca]AYZ55145.1 amino acid ABC transporter substrate-binding protein [Klebsiella oxytoca]EIX9054705.1 transporter substrate-binding domain-containing protein [Klebsiella oxytoca]EJV1072588.1 transporter substrate-binding domain-containing protein [Klebsiella oxytoca]EKU6745162.1 transporter substrate-binding domain-containing protein [Klebsiella oxytoca]EKU7138909.1 transporter substrate-binding domain-containing protein
MIERHEQKKYLRFAINLGNPVLTILSPDGSPGGITVELAKKLATESQREARLVTWPTAGQVVDAALMDQWDIAFLAIDPAREDKLRFTPSYVTIESSLMVKKESKIQSVQEMDREGSVINVGKGAAYELYLIRTLKHATLRQYATSQDAIQAFINGEGDMVAGIRQPLEKAARDNPQFRVLPDSFSQIHQAICVPRNATQHYEFICRCLFSWIADGTIAGMVSHHIGNS